MKVKSLSHVQLRALAPFNRLIPNNFLRQDLGSPLFSWAEGPLARECNSHSSVALVSRDLMSWINGIRGLVSSDELAKDVTGAEALLERHQVGWPAEQHIHGDPARPGGLQWLTREWAAPPASYLIPPLLLAGTPDRN